MSLNELLSIPIIQAPMAGSSKARLVAAVSNQGALGSLGAAMMSPSQIKQEIDAIKQQTTQPFAVNLFSPQPAEAPLSQQKLMCKILQQHVCVDLDVNISPVKESYKPDFEEQLAVVIAEKVPVFSFTFGLLPTDAMRALKSQGCIVIGTATTLREAQMLIQSGVDAVVAQGIEAGGHRGVFDPSNDQALPLSSLLEQMVNGLPTPIIAAGGIASHSDVKKALDSGATAVQVGTAFLTVDESSANSLHKNALLEQTSDCTQITRVFTGRPARAISNSFIQRMSGFESMVLPFPIQRHLTAPIRNKALMLGREDMCNLWAGQKAHLCRSLSAKDLILSLSNK